MKIELFFCGKTTDAWLREGIDEYLDRLRHYVPVAVFVFEPPRGADGHRSVAEVSAKMLERIRPSDAVMVLDENGKSFSSEAFAALLQKKMVEGTSKLVIVTGGAYGISEPLKKRANHTVSFSALTFTHQMIRLLLAEQLYRAMTILRNEKYHHAG